MRSYRRNTIAVCLGLALAGAAGLQAQNAPSVEPTPAAAQDPASSSARAAPLPPPEFLPHCLKLIEQKRYAAARALLEPVLADHPNWPRAHFYLALTYHKENRYAAARDLYDRVLELDPQYHTVRLFYGWCLYYLGQLQAAREMFESYLIVKPDYTDAIFALGLIDFDSDEIETARGRFEKAIELAQRNQNRAIEAKARARLADVHVRAGDLDGALLQLQRSIELNPNNYEAHFKLSRVLDRLGDHEAAAAARTRHRELLERAHPGASGG